MSDNSGIGTYEGEVLRALGEVGTQQREASRQIAQLTTLFKELDASLIELRKLTASVTTGLSQRMIALEDRTAQLEIQTIAHTGTIQALGTRADMKEKQVTRVLTVALWIIAIALIALVLVGIGILWGLWRG